MATGTFFSFNKTEIRTTHFTINRITLSYACINIFIKYRALQTRVLTECSELFARDRRDEKFKIINKRTPHEYRFTRYAQHVHECH